MANRAFKESSSRAGAHPGRSWSNNEARMAVGHSRKEDITIWTRPHTAPEPGLTEFGVSKEHPTNKGMRHRLAQQDLELSHGKYDPVLKRFKIMQPRVRPFPKANSALR